MSSNDEFFAIDLDDTSAQATSRGDLPSASLEAEARREPVRSSEPLHESALDLDETVLEGSSKAEAEYSLENPVRCSSCRKMISGVLAVRLVRSRVSFISTLPRRGYLTVCPSCRAVLPADLGGLLI